MLCHIRMLIFCWYYWIPTSFQMGFQGTQNPTAMAWEFLPGTVRPANPWPCIITVAEDGAGWLWEPRVYKKFSAFLIYSWHSFSWERLVIPLEAKLFSASSSAAATIWLLVKHFPGRAKDKWPALSFLRCRSTAALCRWRKQATSKFPASAWQQWPSVLGSKRPSSLGTISPTSLSKQTVPKPPAASTADPATSCRPGRTGCSSSGSGPVQQQPLAGRLRAVGFPAAPGRDVKLQVTSFPGEVIGTVLQRH